jgi:hypothetical protein
MADEVHFALKKNAPTELSGLTVAGFDGEFVNVLEKLDEGDGVLSTSDAGLIGALDAVDVLKRVPAKQAEDPPTKFSAPSAKATASVSGQSAGKE